MKSFTFLLLVFIANSFSLPTKTDAGEFFWFPNPREDGTLMKAYLRGEPGHDYVPGSVEDIHYYLYTQENPDTPDEIFVGDESSVENSHFDKTLPIKFISHGFGGTFMDGCPRSIRAAYLRLSQGYNVIVLDWEKLAENPWYHLAANNTILVGERTAELIEFLVEKEYTKLEDIHFIGHSLGSHVAGNTGFALNIGKIARISEHPNNFFEGSSSKSPTVWQLEIQYPNKLCDVVNRDTSHMQAVFGLRISSGKIMDFLRFGPRPPNFTDEFRLDPTDAQFVDVMHTAAGTLLQGGLAFVEPRGHVDYYPNSGTRQPGCGTDLFGSCSHGRTCSYFEQSILAEAGEFTSCRCSTWEGFANEECLCKIKTAMGAHVDLNTPTGTYYLHTNGQSPFARGDDMSPPPPTTTAPIA